MPIIPNNDPNEAYVIRPVTDGFGSEYGWTVVTCNSQPARYYWPSYRHLADRYVSDPAYRLSMVEKKDWEQGDDTRSSRPFPLRCGSPLRQPEGCRPASMASREGAKRLQTNEPDRVYVEVNSPFLFKDGASLAEYRAGMNWLIAEGCIERHESGCFFVIHPKGHSPTPPDANFRRTIKRRRLQCGNEAALSFR